MYELKEEKSLKLYDLIQAASILKIDSIIMDNLVESGQIDYLILGGQMLIPRQFLFEYIKQGLKQVQECFDERVRIQELIYKCQVEELRQNEEEKYLIEKEINEANNETIDANNYYPEEENNQNLDQTEAMDNA